MSSRRGHHAVAALEASSLVYSAANDFSRDLVSFTSFPWYRGTFIVSYIVII